MIKNITYAVGLSALLLGPAMAEDLTIGAVNAKTGFMAPFDGPFMQGVRMYVDEANADGGLNGKYPINLVERDDASDLQKSVVMASEIMAENPDMSVFITSTITPSALAQGAQSLASGMLTIHALASQPTIPKRLGDGSFLVMMSDAHMGAAYAKYASEDLQAKMAYIVTSDFDPYTQFLPLYFKEEFEEDGGKVIGQAEFAYDQGDFSAVVADIKALEEQPDVIMGMPLDNDFPIFIKQLRAAGIQAVYLGPDVLDQPSVKGLGSVVDGVHYVTMAAKDTSSEANDFFEAYEAQFGNADAAYPAMVGYSFMKLVASAAEQAGTVEKGALRDAFGKLSGVATEIGQVKYEGFGALPNLPVHIMKIENGKGMHMRSITLTVEEIPTILTE